MVYSGMDIQLKDFKKSVRGYDINEVRIFLDDLSRQVESMDYENKVLKDKLREKELMLLEFRDREETLRDTMVTAQKVTEGIKNEASKEAMSIVNQSKMRAVEVLSEAKSKMKSTVDEINRLKKQKMEITSALKALLETHLRIVNNYEDNFDDFIELSINHNNLKPLSRNI